MGVPSRTLSPVPPRQRRLLASLTAAAVAAAALQAMTGTATLVLYVAPCLLIVALLLCDRYLGEDSIVRRRLALAAPRASRRRAARWPRDRERPLASLLDRTPRHDRGPPLLLGV